MSKIIKPIRFGQLYAEGIPIQTTNYYPRKKKITVLISNKQKKNSNLTQIKRW